MVGVNFQMLLVGFSTSAEILNDGMVGVNFQMLLGSHVAHGGCVTQSLSLHDTLYVGGPTVLRCDNAAGRGNKSGRDGDLLNLLVQDVLHDLAQGLKLLDILFTFLLFLLILGKLKSFLGDRNKVLALEFLELLDNVFINWLSHVDNLKATLLQSLNKRARRDNLL